MCELYPADLDPNGPGFCKKILEETDRGQNDIMICG